MKEIFLSPYLLKPLQPLNALAKQGVREGCLLQVVWGDGLKGFADLHPWPELGDAPLAQQLRSLQVGELSPLLTQSLQLARRDADLRQSRLNVFDLGFPLRNNFLVTDSSIVDQINWQNIKSLGFASVKMKMGVNLAKDIGALLPIAAAGLKLRLDFNARSTWGEFRSFIDGLSSEVRPLIEYVEDPFPYDLKLWSEGNQLVPLAIDHQYDNVAWDLLTSPPFSVVIVKPAKMNTALAASRCQSHNLKMTVTSSMDHPLGVVQALGVAMSLKKEHPDMVLDAGCWTHVLYEPDAFSEKLGTQGPYVPRVEGYGAGFDQLLEALPWQKMMMN